MKSAGFVARCFLCIVVFAVSVFMITACDDLFGGSSGDSSGAQPTDPSLPPQDGTLTVVMTAAYAGDDEYLWCRLYSFEEWNIDYAPSLLAAGSAPINSSGGTTTVVLKTADDNFGYTGNTWRGTGGLQYDVYVTTGDENGTPNLDSARYGFYPVRPYINGDTTLEVDGLEYTVMGGRLSVTLSGAGVHAGKTFGVGVFETFDEGGPDDPVLLETTEIQEDGSAEIPGSWVEPRDTAYHVIMTVFLEGSPEDGPQSGDLVYKVTPIPWYVNTDRHMTPRFADFVLRGD